MMQDLILCKSHISRLSKAYNGPLGKHLTLHANKLYDFSTGAFIGGCVHFDIELLAK